jgi:capsular polysaccharide biosynthesis protein
LRHRNFEIVEAENLSWREQADLFAGASVIVAPHGAAAIVIGIGSSPQLPGFPTR